MLGFVDPPVGAVCLALGGARRDGPDQHGTREVIKIDLLKPGTPALTREPLRKDLKLKPQRVPITNRLGSPSLPHVISRSGVINGRGPQPMRNGKYRRVGEIG